MKRFVSAFLAIGYLSLVGCASSQLQAYTRMSGEVSSLQSEAVYNKISGVLIDQGFDIKYGNKDLGVVTTEWRKFGNADVFLLVTVVPFDFYLQIKANIKQLPDGRTQLTLTPITKEVNRRNAAAFTERPLMYFDEAGMKKPQSGLMAAHQKGQIMFQAVAKAIAEACGLEYTQMNSEIQMVTL